MSDPQYWESLKKAAVFIYISLFLMFLTVGIFVYLYGRIGKYAFWSSPFWIKLKVPLIVLGAVGLFVAIIAYAVHEGKMESRFAREYAQEKGWEFTEYDAGGLKPLIAVILDDLNFNLNHIRTVESGGPRSIYLFDCSYVSKEAVRQHRQSKGTACFVRSDRFPSEMPPVEITTRDWTEKLIAEKVDPGSSSFAEKFLVLSKNPERARALIGEDLRFVMLQHRDKPLYNPVSVTIGPGGAVVLASRTYEHEQLEDLIDLARRIEEKIR